MKNKYKKGYVLATTFAIMMIILVLSLVIVLIVSNIFLTKTAKSIYLENDLNVKQIANEYVVLSEADFISSMETYGYECEDKNNIIQLTLDDMIIKIDKSQANTVFNIFKSEKQLAEIVRDNDEIILWRY